MTALLIRNARALTLNTGAPPGIERRGAAMSNLAVLPSADVLIENGIITEVGASSSPAHSASRTAHTAIDARGRVLMPGFIDCHTHALWAGDRLDEWDMKRRGVSYLDILKAGGGIMSTVRALRAASDEHLAANLRARLRSMLREGTTTVEVKTGYGLSAHHELRMLRLISAPTPSARGQGEGYVAPSLPTTSHSSSSSSSSSLPSVLPTALLAHAIDPDRARPDFINEMQGEALDAAHALAPRVAIDAYCESGAWSLDECITLFERAIALGHPFRVHTDQFNSLGMTDWAIDHGARSVDHLEASTPEAIAKLACSNTIGVVLPCAGFHTDARYANARAIIDQGGAVALATNLNPGSAPCASMPMAIALAVRYCGMTPAEAITACTVNAAAVLSLADRGTIAPGQRADLILLRHTDERQLAYEFGGNPVDAVIHVGRIVSE